MASKAEILASDMSPVEKIWAIASRRSDIGAGNFGALPEGDLLPYERAGSCCCPIGAVLIGEQCVRGHYQDAADLLGVPVDWVLGFTSGFDPAAVLCSTPQTILGRADGQAMRRRFEAMGVDLG